MSQKYRELMRKHGEVEMKFPQVKAWREDMLARAEKDPTLVTESDFSYAIHGVWKDYYSLIGQYIGERLEIEEQIRNELEAMNMLPIQQRTLGAFRSDGKVDFGKAFLFLADQVQTLSEKIDCISVKTEETNRVLVDLE